MGTFAVMWWRSGGLPRVGKLDVRAGTACLTAREAEPLTFALDEVVGAAIARSPAVARAEGRPALEVRLSGGREVFVQGIVGFAVLHELADALAPVPPRAA